MSELISKQDTLKRLCKRCTEGDENAECDRWKCIEYQGIESMPSAVVRCKDCKHWRNGHICMVWSICAWSIHGAIETKGDDFCSYGEKGESEVTNG